MNECLKQKIKEYIIKLGLECYDFVYIPNYVIEKFEMECEKNDKNI